MLMLIAAYLNTEHFAGNFYIYVVFDEVILHVFLHQKTV